MSEIHALEYLAGLLQCYPLQANSYNDAPLKVGRGRYSVFRIYPGNMELRFHNHLDLLQRSATIPGMPFPHHPVEIRESVRLAPQSTKISLPLVRLLALQDFSPSTQEECQQCVQVATAPLKRIKITAKESRFIRIRDNLRQLHPQSREILIFVEVVRTLEGISSYYFVVLIDEFRTAGEGVLEGVSRSILSEVAYGFLLVNLKSIYFCDRADMQETFMTCMFRGILPTNKVGDIQIWLSQP